MAAQIFDGSTIRIVIETETDAFSSDNETTYAGIRKLIERLIQWMKGEGSTGSVTTAPPDNTDGYLYDSAASWSDDEHNGRSVVMTSGTAKGKAFKIDDTDGSGSPPKLVCQTLAGAAVNLVTQGVTVGDDYEIFYDLSDIVAHTHDGTDAEAVVLPDNTVQMSIMTSDDTEQNVSGTSPAAVFTFYMWLPSNVQNLTLAMRLKTNNGSYAAGGKIVISGTSIAVQGTTQTSYTWRTPTANVDVSALAGAGYEVSVQLYSNNASGTSYLQGLSVAFTSS